VLYRVAQAIENLDAHRPSGVMRRRSPPARLATVRSAACSRELRSLCSVRSAVRRRPLDQPAWYYREQRVATRLAFGGLEHSAPGIGVLGPNGFQAVACCMVCSMLESCSDPVDFGCRKRGLEENKSVTVNDASLMPLPFARFAAETHG
jgi:hypothetical protein